MPILARKHFIHSTALFLQHTLHCIYSANNNVHVLPPINILVNTVVTTSTMHVKIDDPNNLHIIICLGERRLNENTNMLALYAVNPNASWILKPKNYTEVTSSLT